ncbi:MAG: hypothetical protein ACE5PM_09385 [Candidatus Hydrothermarchaeales archaeon]
MEGGLNMVTAAEINRYLARISVETRNGYLSKFLIEMNPSASENKHPKPRKDLTIIRAEIDEHRAILKDLSI